MSRAAIGPKEADIQAEMLKYLALRGIFAFPIPNHGRFDPVRRAYVITVRGFVKGVPDVCCPLANGRTFWIEVKRPGRDAEPAQEAVHVKLRGLGHDVLVAHSVRELHDYLEGRAP